MGLLVGVIMGSDSDLKVMQKAADVLEEYGVPREVRVISAHRTPLAMVEYAQTAEERGLEIIIACAGGAAHLPGMTAALTPLPVIGVPRSLDNLQGLDSLLSIVQMPSSVPVATVAIDGAMNAGLLAVRMLAKYHPELSLQEKLAKARQGLEATVMGKDALVRSDHRAGEAA